jgi:hypothetical protein
MTVQSARVLLVPFTCSMRAAIREVCPTASRLIPSPTLTVGGVGRTCTNSPPDRHAYATLTAILSRIAVYEASRRMPRRRLGRDIGPRINPR